MIIIIIIIIHSSLNIPMIPLASEKAWWRRKKEKEERQKEEKGIGPVSLMFVAFSLCVDILYSFQKWFAHLWWSQDQLVEDVGDRDTSGVHSGSCIFEIWQNSNRSY